MTQEELDALPDVTPSFGYVCEVVDGKRVQRAVLLGHAGALYMGDDDGHVFCARTGTGYMVGWINGRRVKRAVV